MFQYTDIILDNARSSLTEIYDMIHIFVHISVTTDIWGNIAKNLCLSASMLIYFLILASASKIESLLGPKSLRSDVYYIVIIYLKQATETALEQNVSQFTENQLLFSTVACLNIQYMLTLHSLISDNYLDQRGRVFLSNKGDVKMDAKREMIWFRFGHYNQLKASLFTVTSMYVNKLRQPWKTKPLTKGWSQRNQSNPHSCYGLCWDYVIIHHKTIFFFFVLSYDLQI